MQYQYLGKERTAIALPPKKEGDPLVEVPLIPQGTAELPEELDYTKRLVAKGLLVAIHGNSEAIAQKGKTKGGEG